MRNVSPATVKSPDDDKVHYRKPGSNPPRTICGKEVGEPAEPVSCTICKAKDIATSGLNSTRRHSP
jgi:hypothetical protein